MAKMIDSTAILNQFAEDFSELSKERKKIRAVYCVSYDCTANTRGRRGRLIHRGDFKIDRCPKCGQRDYLNFSTSCNTGKEGADE
jgi:hypothetical protein